MADRFGYQRIVGVDKSEDILGIAANRTAATYSNIDYHRVDVPMESVPDIESLGGFDIALVNWLFAHADTKSALLKMMLWTNRMMKSGGTVIGWTVATEDIRNADEGVVKDPKFRMNTYFDGGEKREGAVRQTEDEMEYRGSIYTFNTYHTLFQVAGFENVHFLEHHEYVAGRGTSNSSRAERAMFEELITWKGAILKVFRATKL